MNYREKIRKAIECPQFRDKNYGEWGALNLEQKKLIKRLLNELDSADNYIKKLYLKNTKQKEVIDKAIKFVDRWIDNWYKNSMLDDKGYLCLLLDILKEVSE